MKKSLRSAFRKILGTGIVLTLISSSVPFGVIQIAKAQGASISASEATIVNPEYASEDGVKEKNFTRLVLKLRPGTDPQTIAQQVQAEILRQGPLDYITLGIEEDRVKEAIQALSLLPGVLNVTQSEVVKTAEVSVSQVTDPHYSEQWGLTQAEVPRAWAEGASGEGVTIAIVDTGVDINHPDLKENLIEGYNAITGKTTLTSVQDNNGHGTHVAGVAAAGLNGEGIVGVAYKAKIMPIKAMDRTGEGTDDVIADGIIWAADHGAKIINLSLGSEGETEILKEAIQYAQEKGALIVAAAGNKDPNQSLDTITFPASEPGVIAVTATDTRDQIASFSLTGPQAALAAPGVNIFSDYWQNRSGYTSSDGTSMASPFVAGVAALVWGANPELTAEEVKVILENSTKDLGAPGRDSYYGYGRVNAYWALKFAAKPEILRSPANVTWAGGIVHNATEELTETTASTESSVSLTIPSRAFGLDPEKRVSVQITSVQNAPDFPQGTIPAGKGFSVEWEGTVQKTLGLSVALPSGADPKDENQLGYLYHWTGTRWIMVGGGIDSSDITAGIPQGISAGITEPGMYRVGYQALPENHRLAGEDRIQTAVQISQASFAIGADTVILARADDFPDALAGAPLAYKYHAPILLTEINSLPDSVLQEIKRLDPRKIILLGGSGAISTTVEAQLKTLFPQSLQRIGGANRFATASGIAAELGMIGEAVVVNGNNYPDAISIASIAAQKGIPIFLTESNFLPPETDAALRKHLVSQTEIVGGDGVVSPKNFKSLPSPSRLAGEDRYATAAAVLQVYPPKGKLVFLATGEDFPDALTGGVVAAMNNSRILLIPPTGPSTREQEILMAWSGLTPLVFGGTGVISEKAYTHIHSLVQ